MKTWIIAILIGIILGLILNVMASAESQYRFDGPLNHDGELSQVELWNIINEWRLDHKKEPFRFNSDLCVIAQRRMEEVKKDWSHTGFKSQLPEYTAKLNYAMLGENLAKNFKSERDTFVGWLKSQEHLANLEANYTDSCVVTSDLYAVQIFATF